MVFRAFVVGKDSWTKRVASTVQGSTGNKERERTAQHGVELHLNFAVTIIDWRACSFLGSRYEPEYAAFTIYPILQTQWVSCCSVFISSSSTPDPWVIQANMSTTANSATFLRGGSSKGIFLNNSRGLPEAFQPLQNMRSWISFPRSNSKGNTSRVYCLRSSWHPGYQRRFFSSWQPRKPVQHDWSLC